MTEYDDFSRNMKILFEEIRNTFEVCLNQHDGKKLKKLIEEIVNAHNILNGLRQELYNKAIAQEIGARKQTLKAADYVHKVQERLKKILDEMKPYLPIFVREEEKEEKPPKEKKEKRKEKLDEFSKLTEKLEEFIKSAEEEKIPSEDLKKYKNFLKESKKYVEEKAPISDSNIENIKIWIKNLDNLIEEQKGKKKLDLKKKTELSERIKELKKAVVEVGLDKEMQGKVDDAGKQLERAISDDDLDRIEGYLNSINGVIEEAKPINEKLLEKIKEAEKLGLPEAETGQKLLKEGRIQQKEQVTKEIESAVKRAEELNNKLREGIKELEGIMDKLSDEDKEEAGTLIGTGKKIIERSTIDDRVRHVEKIDRFIKKKEGKIEKEEKKEENKEKLERAEAPEEIPKNIVNLYTEFRRNLGDDDRGAYHYMLQIQDKCFPENIPGYHSLPEDKTKRLREMQMAANFFISVYKLILPKILNEKSFYEMLIYLSTLGRRKVIWVRWFGYLPQAIKGIREAKDNLKKERDENAKIKDVNKDLIKRYDHVINELLGTETMKLLDNLDEIYHNIIKQVENLKPEK